MLPRYWIETISLDNGFYFCEVWDTLNGELMHFTRDLTSRQLARREAAEWVRKKLHEEAGDVN